MADFMGHATSLIIIQNKHTRGHPERISGFKVIFHTVGNNMLIKVILHR